MGDADSTLEADSGKWSLSWALHDIGQSDGVGKLQKTMMLTVDEGIVMDLDRAKCAVFVQQNTRGRTVLARGAALHPRCPQRRALQCEVPRGAPTCMADRPCQT